VHHQVVSGDGSLHASQEGMYSSTLWLLRRWKGPAVCTTRSCPEMAACTHRRRECTQAPCGCSCAGRARLCAPPGRVRRWQPARIAGGNVLKHPVVVRALEGPGCVHHQVVSGDGSLHASQEGMYSSTLWLLVRCKGPAVCTSRSCPEMAACTHCRRGCD